MVRKVITEKLSFFDTARGPNNLRDLRDLTMLPLKSSIGYVLRELGKCKLTVYLIGWPVLIPIISTRKFLFSKIISQAN